MELTTVIAIDGVFGIYCGVRLDTFTNETTEKEE
jgi:hypothetical protein